MASGTAPFLVLVAAVAVPAGAIASVSGYGIGSLLTPLLALQVETKLAVVAMSVPHLAAGVALAQAPCTYLIVAGDCVRLHSAGRVEDRADRRERSERPRGQTHMADPMHGKTSSDAIR
jgi:hypothetical protein